MDSPVSFFDAVRATPHQLAQNRLLDTADRDLAAVLSASSAEDASFVLELLGEAKRTRIEEEMTRMRHVRLAPATVERIARHLAVHVAGDRPLGPASRYFKPVRDDD